MITLLDSKNNSYKKTERVITNYNHIKDTQNVIENDGNQYRKTILAESYEIYRKSNKRNKNLLKKSSTKQKKKNKKVSKYEIYLLAKLIYCEVGTIKDDRCLYLCGSVVLNRIKDKRYPDTMESVIFQKGQYEVTWNGAWDKKTPDKRCIKIARKLLKEGTVDKRVIGMSERVWGKFHSRFGNVVFSIC